ncbi:MAG: hypothetical protein IH596_13465 [Bacteroidales bacterium]|nr:hypothetical protein [Bacteroidales bacterium]
MNRYHTPYSLLLLALLSICPALKAQDLLPDAAGERIEAVTDRTLFISGEEIFFSVAVCQPIESNAQVFSRVFYCELISPDGNRIAGSKYPLQDFNGEGSLTIPEETISGIYFLKFYTRFMRNNNTGGYTYIMLKIINPFKAEILKGYDLTDADTWIEPHVKTDEMTSVLTLPGDKTRFAPRSNVEVTISAKSRNEPASGLSISVIPEFTWHGLFLQERNITDTISNGIYYPETRGISLSGKLIAKESGDPLPNAIVSLSIIGDKDILAVRTDTAGKFFFALPDYRGNKDIFLCSEDLPEVTPELFIDNDFCSRPVHLPSPPFELTKDEKNAAFKLAVNSLVTAAFDVNPMVVDSLEPEEEAGASFYGKPTEVLVMERYIDLPTLEEYFTELTVNVKIRKEQSRKRFRFLTDLAAMQTYDPLLLVDWVAVDNMEKILSMSPLDIDRIELVNAPYIKGDITYGGIISFVSKKNDFAGIDLPTSGTFVNYQFLEEPGQTDSANPLPVHIPDSRNTVYWNPAIQPGDDGTATIAFTAPDTPGKYIILLRQMNPDGKVIITQETIEVTVN